MTKITMLEFCPQCETDTQEAITEAKNIIKNGGDVELRPNTNLFHADCIGRLTAWGFLYNGSKNTFVKSKK